jgi:branched-chain amino acid transport system substrate-binding protein
MLLNRRQALLGTAIGSFAITGRARAEDTIKVGVTVPLTGPAAEAGQFMQWGATLALEAINGGAGVLGKKLEVVYEDDQTTNPGAVLAFSRLVNRGDCAAFLASIRSTQVNAIAPDVIKAAKPVMFGGTDPTLTHSGNPWLFRCRPNDTFSARVIADYGVNTLKKTKWALVHSTDAFGNGGKNAMLENLKKLNIEPVLVQGYTNQQTDFTPVVLAVKQANPDILCSYFTFEADLGIFARQLRQLGVRQPWIGSPSIINTTSLNLAGPALWGTYGVADFNEDSSPVAKAFATKYMSRFKKQADDLSSWVYDALNILALAMNNAKSTDPKAIRAAILAIKGYAGTEGTYTYDSNGDGLRGYNVVRNDKGKIVFDKHIEFAS